MAGVYPSPSLYPSGGLYPVGAGVSALRVRERPPLRLYASVATPNGNHYRWAGDEHKPENVPNNLVFSSTIPGGFESCSLTLARRPNLDYADLEEFSTVTVAGAGGQCAWEGRLERTPRTSGDKMSVSPGLVGWQAHLADNNSARMIYVDMDLTHWGPMSAARRLALSGVMGIDDPSLAPDTVSGQPTAITGMTDPWSSAQGCEAWYNAKGVAIWQLYYAWKHDGTVYDADANWSWLAVLSNIDDMVGVDATGSLRAAGPGSGWLTATAASRKWAHVQASYGAAYTDTSGIARNIYWTCLAVYGYHGLIGRNAATATTPSGFWASDIVGHAVATFAPKIATSRAGESTIQPSNYIIMQAAFLDPTTASEIIKQATRFDLQDWAVWEGPTFYFAPRGFYGRSWRARVGPTGLSENGPQVDKIWNGVVVSATDVSGSAITAGPPGSGANYETTDLVDTDPTNPANVAGITRWTGLTMGVSAYDPSTTRPGAAIKVGQRFLAEQRLLNTSGDATLTGHVLDDHGVLWPAWAVRAGDTISFTDAHDTNQRRIVRAEYSDATKTCSISLDSPPDAMQALLERLSADIAPLGFS